MLDSNTKRRIDTARDILVGKVPDPKSQVEQITIALIYKFMDDMDAASEEFGGTRTFFADEFVRYGWAKLMRAGLGGHETLNLYAEAITKMPENPGIPPLFRDIFNNAYLPYRDPETLRAFLKVIDEFTYDHSERLGDAFEYLLSVLGSQGDAGQFRTPRHIIDFIVAIIAPKKGETVIDPACGTAGFLISSYKYILAANTDAQGDITLTPDDKGQLAANCKGYDISPDMVRLSLVNMYLHGFADPHIFEYDTLTSEERWDEYADVILANPPFMSPKGGIRPHNRFSVQSKRSEVLFVDYMAEHLMPSGRAGIIVPEGIIFQSQNAYKQLRKMLVEEYLVAVISLPGGVFNPYSGVKTSILILDKSLAKKTDRIAFLKVENDGFDLGAQRRPIDKNDLPLAREEIVGYLQRLRAQEPVDDFQPKLGLIVAKGKIAANGEYNLSGERYRESQTTSSVWPMVPIRDVFKKSDETVLPKSLPGPVTYVSLQNITQTSGKLIGNVVAEDPAEIKSLKNRFQLGDILYGKLRPNLNKVWFADQEGICSTDIFVVRPSDDRVLPVLYAHMFRSARFNEAVRSLLTGAQLPRIGWKFFTNLEIPLPPLEVQKEIVAEIEGYQKVIDGARVVVQNYRPHITIDPKWPRVELREMCKRLQYGLSVQLNTEETGYKTFRMNDLIDGRCVDSGKMKCVDISAGEFAKYRLLPGDILFNRTNSFEHVGRTGIFDLDGDYCFASYLIRVSVSEDTANAFYVNAFMNTEAFQAEIKQYATRAIGQSNINAKSLAAYRIPVPPLTTQNRIVAELEAEQALVVANRELIDRFEKKIEATLARVWNEAEPNTAKA